MVHNDIQGDVIGEIWRGQQGDKEIVYFTVKAQKNWFRIEYTGDLMLDRANYMAEKLKQAAQEGSSVEVGVDYDVLTVQDDPNVPKTTFNLAKYIQIRA